MKRLTEEEKRVVYRILDANANRCAEGLRVVEEVARFGMNDEGLHQRMKEIRHLVRSGMEALTGGSFHFRDSEGDVGRSLSTVSEQYRGSLESVARANFARAEEALRVIEEFGKLIDPQVSGNFKNLRFELYMLEKSFFEAEDHRVKLPPSPFLYAILDRTVVTKPNVATVSEDLVRGGADLIQYRAKGCSYDEMRSDLTVVLARAVKRSIPVIVNDDPELSAEVGAHGVHLGRDDPDPRDARAMLGEVGIIGITVHSLDELERSPLETVDYVAVGSIFSSSTKPEVKPMGLHAIEEVKKSVSVPVVAIGGIDLSNVDLVLDAGADGIALISALLRGDVRKNCFTYREIIDRRLKESRGSDERGGE
jgi:thiamine-phosphate pyrophosphorylase